MLLCVFRPLSHKLHYHRPFGQLDLFCMFHRWLLKQRPPPLVMLHKFPFCHCPVMLDDSLCDRFIQRRFFLHLRVHLPSQCHRFFLRFRLLRFPKLLQFPYTRLLKYFMRHLFPMKSPDWYWFKPGLLSHCSRYHHRHDPSILFHLFCLLFHLKCLHCPCLMMRVIDFTRFLLFQHRPMLLPSKFGLFLQCSRLDRRQYCSMDSLMFFYLHFPLRVRKSLLRFDGRTRFCLQILTHFDPQYFPKFLFLFLLPCYKILGCPMRSSRVDRWYKMLYLVRFILF